MSIFGIWEFTFANKKCGYATSPIALISTFSHTKICYCTLFQDIVFYLLEVDYNVFIYY
mgnify:CR=1 FL=1